VLGLDPEEAVDDTEEFVLDRGMLPEGAEVDAGILERTLVAMPTVAEADDSALALLRMFWLREVEDPERLRD